MHSASGSPETDAASGSVVSGAATAAAAESEPTGAVAPTSSLSCDALLMHSLTATMFASRASLLLPIIPSNVFACCWNYFLKFFIDSFNASLADPAPTSAVVGKTHGPALSVSGDPETGAATASSASGSVGVLGANDITVVCSCTFFVASEIERFKP